MTPKEKAEELTQQFMDIKQIKLSDYSRIEWPTAKQCALITINKLIEVAQDDSHFKHKEFVETHPKYKSYWILVKQEMENL